MTEKTYWHDKDGMRLHVDPANANTADAVSVKAQAAAVRRDVVRGHIGMLANHLQSMIDLPEDQKVDIPEGTVIVNLRFSDTLAKDLVKSLRAAEVMI